MNILCIDERALQSRIAELEPSHLYMSSQTTTLLNRTTFKGLLMSDSGFIGNYQGIPVHVDDSFPIGKIVFGIE